MKLKSRDKVNSLLQMVTCFGIHIRVFNQCANWIWTYRSFSLVCLQRSHSFWFNRSSSSTLVCLPCQRHRSICILRRSNMIPPVIISRLLQKLFAITGNVVIEDIPVLSCANWNEADNNNANGQRILPKECWMPKQNDLAAVLSVRGASVCMSKRTGKCD